MSELNKSQLKSLTNQFGIPPEKYTSQEVERDFSTIKKYVEAMAG
jgi:hypothetical protein